MKIERDIHTGGFDSEVVGDGAGTVVFDATRELVDLTTQIHHRIFTFTASN